MFRTVIAGAVIMLGAAGAEAQYSGAMLQPGEVFTGEISRRNAPMDDGIYVDCLNLDTLAGQNYTVTVQAAEFDVFIMSGEGGCDASAGGADFSYERLTIPGNGGRWAIFVQNDVANDFGRYQLAVSGPGGGSTAVASAGQGGAQASASSHGRGSQTHAAAWAAFQADNYNEALPLMELAAGSGDHESQYALGYMYTFGLGTQRNYLQAAHWLTRAAEQGDTNAQTLLVQTAPNISQALFIDHIDRYGPDTSSFAMWAGDVAEYCTLRGPNCTQLRADLRRAEQANNLRAQSENMARIWNLHGGGQSQEQFFAQSRARLECLRRVRRSIQAQNSGQQDWRYVNTC